MTGLGAVMFNAALFRFLTDPKKGKMRIFLSLG